MRDPQEIETLFQSAQAARGRGDLEPAVAGFNEILSVDPAHAGALREMAQICHHLGRMEAARAYITELARLRPQDPAPRFTLGSLWLQEGDGQAAEEAFRAALTIDPAHPGANVNLGNMMKQAGRLSAAAECYARAVPGLGQPAPVLSNLASVYSAQGLHDEADAAYARALELEPENPMAQSNRLLGLNYRAGLTPEQVATAHRDWAVAHADPMTPAERPSPAAGPDGRLKLGFLSPDFRHHPVTTFLLPLLQAIDRTRFEIYLLSDVTHPDGHTQRLRQLADRWFDCAGRPDQALADQIRQSGLHILVDLAGHTAHNRLRMMARRPAALQASWLGYPNTTGMTAMDLRLVDAVTDPPGPADRLARENLMRLPRGFLCYAGPADAPEPSPPPAIGDAPVTFGSFNNLSKVSSATLDLWARVLLACPGSRLFLKARALGDDPTRERISGGLIRRGIAADRISFAGRLRDMGDHLALYGKVDIALDSIPYNGTTTTCEALWMGVPVIALAGDRHAARVSASILAHAGLPELVAADGEDYVRLAADLAGDPARRAVLRAELRGRLQASPLCDAAGFATAFGDALLQAWDGLPGRD